MRVELDTGALLDRVLPEESPDRDPVAWISSTTGEHLWSKQQEVAWSVRDHRYTAVPSCHDSGKSFTAARLVAWHCSTYPPGEAFAVTTAPTAPQVEAILWREIGRAHRRGKLPGQLTGGAVPMWRRAGELVAYGRKPQDLTDAEAAAAAFQGIHALHVLVVVDEAGGVPPWLWDAVDGLATNEGARVLAIGNPVAGSRFEEVCRPGSGWNVVQIGAACTPNFTDEPVPDDLRGLLLSREWVEERRRRWGEESPLYISRVEGRFPEVADDALISPALVEAAQQRDLSGAVASTVTRYGVDVARSGADESVIYGNCGGVVRLAHRAQGADTMATAGQVALRLLDDSEATAAIDVIGLGAGVFDRLREQGLRAVPFNASERAWRPDRFANRRAESYWALRDAFRAGSIDLDSADDELASQLQSVRYGIDSRGRILIESKDDMRKRGLPSPDRADAVAMAVAGLGSHGQPLSLSTSPLVAGQRRAGRRDWLDEWRETRQQEELEETLERDWRETEW